MKRNSKNLRVANVLTVEGFACGMKELSELLTNGQIGSDQAVVIETAGING